MKNLMPKRKRDKFLTIALLLIVLVFLGLYNRAPEFKQTVDNIIVKVESFVADPQGEAKRWQEKSQKKDIVLGEIKEVENLETKDGIPVDTSFDYNRYYEYNGQPYIIVNNNIPNFKTNEVNSNKGYTKFSPLDSLGRVGTAEALLTRELMPKKERESISSVKPSGWNNTKYDESLVNGGWIYNRSHLIGFQLTGENANELNLMTGTRAFNVEGMLPFENIVAKYVKNGGIVKYRITPVFNDHELVARGIYMEAQSIDTMDVSFFVYVFNNQNGIEIDYTTGETSLKKSSK